MPWPYERYALHMDTDLKAQAHTHTDRHRLKQTQGTPPSLRPKAAADGNVSVKVPCIGALQEVAASGLSVPPPLLHRCLLPLCCSNCRILACHSAALRACTQHSNASALRILSQWSRAHMLSRIRHPNCYLPSPCPQLQLAEPPSWLSPRPPVQQAGSRLTALSAR